jgi:DNA-directed RNA polymerase
MKVRMYFHHGLVYRDRAYPIALHARSQLFMTMLMGKFC